ncbi:DUF6518 family protein [Cellulosimicrobium sp. NPDC057127]|uniref:DUF6518 family protein n=1 Tax=Cellulosimicrobium sp. NPDC057127 TaxID=3346026 RepID=UPI00363B4E80
MTATSPRRTAPAARPAPVLAPVPAPVPARVPLGRAAAVLAAALALGVLTEWLQGVLVDPWAMWANSVAAWVAVAFAAGALVRRPVAAVALGVGAETMLMAGYYGARTLHDVPSDARILAFWLGGALVGGAVFGLAGAWWRSDVAWRQVTGVALLGGVLVSEGLMRWQMFPWQGASGAIMCAVGVVCAVALARSPRQRWLVPLALAATVPLGLLGTATANNILGG